MSEDPTAQEKLKQLRERLELMERALQTNTARLHLVEKHLGIVRQRPPLQDLSTDESSETRATSEVELESLKAPWETPPTPIVTPETEPPKPTLPLPEVPTSQATGTSPPYSVINESSGSHSYATREEAGSLGQSVPSGNTASQAEAGYPEEVREKKRRDLESLIGGRWFNWVGIIAVTFGVAFFLKFAFDKQWIGPTGRVSVAALVGLTFLYLGERLRRRGLKSYAYILSGGGILILYLATFAAYNFYHLIAQKPAFLLMAAVTITTVLLSVRLNALPIAILGLVGGFLTPLLLSTGVDNEVGLFSYVALLDAGVLAVAYFKRWRSLDFLSFAGTVMITLGWALRFFTPQKTWTTLLFLSVFFLLYSLLAIFHNVVPGRPTRWFDVSLAIANATFYFGVSYLMLVEAGFDHVTPATQALLVSVFFTGLFYITWRWNSEDRLLRYSYVGAAATFLAVAVAILLELHWVTIGWAIEALALTWVGLRSGEKAARHGAIAVFCLAVGHWFIWDMPRFAYSMDPSFVPLLNRRALSCGVLVAAIAGAAWLYRNAVNIDENERTTFKSFFALAGNMVALTLLSLDLNDYFAARMTYSGAAQAGWQTPIENARQFSISALWTLYAATMLTLGVQRRNVLLRACGLLLLLVAIGKVIAIDSTFYAAPWHVPIFNQTFIAYGLLVAVLALGVRLYGRTPGVDEPVRHVIRTVCLVSANVLTIAALSLESIGYYERQLATLAVEYPTTEIVQRLQEGEIFTLALVWTVYATGVFLISVRRGSRPWRLAGLAFLGITTFLVLANLGYYDARWHTLILNRTMAAFAVFIAALWLVVRSYVSAGASYEEAVEVRTGATILANILAIVALSAQGLGYYEAKIGVELSATLTSHGLPVHPRNLELAKQLSLSVVWALYACGLLVAGRMRNLRLLRVMSLALLSLTTLKAFFWDLASLDRIYRIISFVMLGAILLVVSYFYQRGQQTTEE